MRRRYREPIESGPKRVLEKATAWWFGNARENIKLHMTMHVEYTKHAAIRIPSFNGYFGNPLD